MKYTMTAPCPKCPFRTDIPGYLTRERVRQIDRALDHGSFTCHLTTILADDDGSDMVDGPNAQHCAGALIYLEKQGRSHQMMRIAERLGMYDAEKLDMAAPVYDDRSDMEAAQPRSGVAGRGGDGGDATPMQRAARATDLSGAALDAGGTERVGAGEDRA